MESMANSVEDYLISGLSFKLDPGASYVTDRKSVSFFLLLDLTYIQADQEQG